MAATHLESLNADKLREDWLKRLSSLVDTVDTWAKELGWATRRIEKRLSESLLGGTYMAPALLLQEETVRIILDPIGSSAPAAEGVVDLYLMPAYDDIATLFFIDGKWRIYFTFPGTLAVVSRRSAKAKLLTKKTLRDVLEALKKNA